MTDKLAEEILEKNIPIRGLIDLGNYSCVGIPYEAALKAMQAYHEAKMKEVTDEDIDVHIIEHYELKSVPFCLGFTKGAKAMCHGEIKHIEPR